MEHGKYAGPDEGQARLDHGRCQRPFDCLGHCQSARRTRRRACVHLSGRSLGQARQAARRTAWGTHGSALRCRGHRQRRCRFRCVACKMGAAGFSGPCHRLFRQERVEGPLRRHLARKLFADAGDLMLLFHGTCQARGSSMITLTYGGSTRVLPNYNVMGVAKAALEASVRYLAADFGPRNIRVNTISAGPIRTLAGAGIADQRDMLRFQQLHAPLRRTVTIDEVGGSALYLLSDLSTGVTGEIHYVDSGYNIISMPRPEDLKNGNGAE